MKADPKQKPTAKGCVIIAFERFDDRMKSRYRVGAMATGTLGYRKTVKKSEHFWKHGYNYGHLICYVAQLNRDREQHRRAAPRMFSSVQEAFASAKRRQRRPG